MNILVIDIGGRTVKVKATGQPSEVKFESGPTLTPAAMVAGVKSVAGDWSGDAISIGFPGPVVAGHIGREPYNLASGWVGFDFATAFGKPVRIVNDALMQALGSRVGGRMLFLGLGTGLGTALIDDGHAMALELGHLPFRRATYEDYVSRKALERVGRRRWERRVHRLVALFSAAFVCETVVLGGGNAKRLKTLPPNAVLGDNDNAFIGGFRLWEEAGAPSASPSVVATSDSAKP